MTTAQTETGTGSRTAVRWRVCALLLMSTTLVYLNRTTLSVLKPTLEDKLHFGEAEYGWLQFAFTTAYALMFVLAGRFVDWVGAKISLAVGVIFWSATTAVGGLCRTWQGLAAVQFFLGCGASVNFPASFKALAEWFPQKERALAAGIFNSGSNLGIMVAVVATIAAAHFGWPWGFYIVGATGALWLMLWIPFYQPIGGDHSANEAELTYIRAGQPVAPPKIKVPWTALLRYRQTWPFVIAKFLTDPVWWFYSNWLPGYLHDYRHLSITGSAGMLAIPYIAADFGSIFGGWLSGGLMQRGFNVGAARYIAMGLCAAGMPGAIIAVYTDHLWLAIALISVATASHQGWSANLFTTATDLFPSAVTGSMVGLGGMAGAVGGMLMSLAVGDSLSQFHSYVPVFIWAGLMHPLAWIVFILFAGVKMKKAEMTADIDKHLSPTLLIAGLIIALLGAMRVFYVYTQWQEYSKATVAAGALVAGSAVGLIGIGLLFASLPRGGKSTAPAN